MKNIFLNIPCLQHFTCVQIKIFVENGIKVCFFIYLFIYYYIELTNIYIILN